MRGLRILLAAVFALAFSHAQAADTYAPVGAADNMTLGGQPILSGDHTWPGINTFIHPVFPSQAVSPTALQAPIIPTLPDTIELFATVTSSLANKDITLGGGSFTTADVGKLIRVEAIGPNERWLNTSITAVADATHITVADQPTQAVTAYASQKVIYGSDQATSIQAAFTAAANAGRAAYINAGHYLVGSALTCPIPANASSYANNFYEPPALCDMAAGTIVDYVGSARIGAVITYGAPSYAGYIHSGHMTGGTVNCGFNANYAQEIPFAIDVSRAFVGTKNCMHAGLHMGSQSAPAEGGGLTDIEDQYIRETSSVTVSTCTTGSATITCTTTQPHGFCNQGRTKQPVVAIIGASTGYFSTDWFRVTCPSATAFTIKGVDGTTWGTWSGTAQASITMPSMRVPQKIVGVTLANPAVVNVPDTSDLTNGDAIHIAETIGLTSGTGTSARKCLDGVYTLTVVDATHYSVPVDTSACTAYSTGGWSEQWVDPTTADACVYMDYASDNNVFRGTCQGVRFGYVHNPAYAGYDGKIIAPHVWDYASDGSIFAAVYAGGKTRIDDLQVDTPAKYGAMFFGNFGNSVAGMEINGNGFGNGTWMRNNYTALVRMSANAAEGGVAGHVNIRDGVLHGATALLNAAYVRSSNFPFTAGLDIYGDVVGVDQSLYVVSPQNSTFGVPGGTVGFSQGATVQAGQYVSAWKTTPGTVDSGIQFDATGQTLGFYTANAWRGGIQSDGSWRSQNGFNNAGSAGVTATKTAGACVFMISGGIITNVTGC